MQGKQLWRGRDEDEVVPKDCSTVRAQRLTLKSIHSRREWGSGRELLVLASCSAVQTFCAQCPVTLPFHWVEEAHPPDHPDQDHQHLHGGWSRQQVGQDVSQRHFCVGWVNFIFPFATHALAIFVGMAGWRGVVLCWTGLGSIS